MTEHEQRVAIAEWMGLVPETRTPAPSGAWDFVLNPLPDFTHDLNAIHQAVIKLTSAQKEQFLHWLMGVCRGQAKAAYGFVSEDAFTALWIGTFASATQRAEALLRCLNLWKDP